MTVDNFPSYHIGNSGRVFATKAAAEEWANTQATTEGSPWFDCLIELSQPNDPDFQNTENNPWTVNFYKY